MLKKVIPFGLLAWLCLPAWAADMAIMVEGAWARASPPGVTNGAAYMTLTNHTNTADRLLGASADVAEAVELHTHMMEGDMMKMRRVEAIEVPVGEPAVLQPGGLHIMMIGLKAPLQEGQAFLLTLRFERAGEMTVELPIKKNHGGSHGQGHSGHNQ